MTMKIFLTMAMAFIMTMTLTMGKFYWQVGLRMMSVWWHLRVMIMIITLVKMLIRMSKREKDEAPQISC